MTNSLVSISENLLKMAFVKSFVFLFTKLKQTLDFKYTICDVLHQYVLLVPEPSIDFWGTFLAKTFPWHGSATEKFENIQCCFLNPCDYN